VIDFAQRHQPSMDFILYGNVRNMIAAMAKEGAREE
jgi:hypothetical protein